MSFTYRLLILWLFTVPLLITASPNWKIGQVCNGFKLLRNDSIPELEARGYLFEHTKSGAHLLKIANQDDNKTFCISFSTPVDMDGGIPHIIEHSVLNGSRKYPVKSPFDVLSKGSLNTFINAFTANDRTMYPVASRNIKDYYNLMDVYLDAVLFPLLYEDPRIFYQEGWHYELNNADDPIIYKGVVYNEMKGAFSSPTRELDYRIMRNLFPGNAYQFSAGGYPSAIPQLTLEKFQQFHKQYYHPANSYIFLYGDADLEKELAYIDQNFLQQFDKIEVKARTPLQKPFDKPRSEQAWYPVGEDEATEDKTYLAQSWVASEAINRTESMGLELLAELLVNHPAAPVREALLKAGIGKNVSADFSDYQQNVFSIIAQNANTEDAQKFQDLIRQTLADLVKTGLDKKMVEGAVNQMEFRLREGADNGGFPKALLVNYRALSGWIFANDPFISLGYEKPLAEIKKLLPKNYLEGLIDKYFLKNNHALFVKMDPKPGLEKEIQAQTDKELAEYKAKLTPAEIDALVKQTQELKAFQEEVDSEEKLATIPLLELTDIDPKAAVYTAETRDINATPLLLYPTFTNQIVYQTLFFNASTVPQELIPYIGLLRDILTELNTKNFSYGDLNTELAIHTGGITFNVATYENFNDPNQYIPRFEINGKAFTDKFFHLLDLEEEVMNRTQFADSIRLREVLATLSSRIDNSIGRNGYATAIRRLLSYFAPSKKYNQLVSGYDYYLFIKDLETNFDQKFQEIQSNLAKVSQFIFQQPNLTIGITAEEKQYAKIGANLAQLIDKLGKRTDEKQLYQFDPATTNEGFTSSSKVQYVAQGFNFRNLGFEYDGRLAVLSQILSRDYLHNTIRVMGGAYGGWSVFSSNGTVYFTSYRDPNLKETLNNYQKAAEFLQNFSATERELTRYIIGTIAGKDDLLLPHQKGETAFDNFLRQVPADFYQKERDNILQVKVEDIRGMAPMIEKILSQNVFCVYGNETKLNENLDLFKKLIKISN